MFPRKELVSERTAPATVEPTRTDLQKSVKTAVPDVEKPPKSTGSDETNLMKSDTTFFCGVRIPPCGVMGGSLV